MSITTFATAILLRQAEPPEGRAKYPMGQGSGGGDGFAFATGNEIYGFNTEQIQGPQKPSGIFGIWGDATGITAGKNIYVQIGTQKFVFQGGATGQGYIPVNAVVPANVKITADAGAVGTFYCELYNFNPLFSGVNSGGGISVSGGGGAGAFSRGGPGKQIR